MLQTAIRRTLGHLDRAALATSLVVSTVPTAVLVGFAGWPAMQDFGAWLYQGRVLAWVWAGHASAFEVASYPVPYSLAQTLLAVANLVASPVVAALICIALYIVAGAVAVSLFVRRYHLSSVNAGAFLTVTIVLGSGYWNGYVGTQLGGILLLAYLGVNRRAVTSYLGVIVASLAMFFAHAINFAVWALIALVLAIAVHRIVQFVVGILPAVMLLIWYAISSSEAATGVVTPDGLAAFFGYKAYSFAKFGGYQNFISRGVGDFTQSPAIYLVGIATNVLFIFMLVVALVRVVLVRRTLFVNFRPEAVALALLVIIVAALPQFAFGIVNPGERVASGAIILAAVFVMKRDEASAWIPRTIVVSLLVGICLTVASAATLPAKTRAGSAAAANDTRSTATSLLGHRTDELEAAVEAAERSWNSGTTPRFPLVWETSLLLQATSQGLQSWRNPYGDGTP